MGVSGTVVTTAGAVAPTTGTASVAERRCRSAATSAPDAYRRDGSVSSSRSMIPSRAGGTPVAWVGERSGTLSELAFGEGDDVGRLERRRARNGFVEDRSERVEVAARVGRAALELLGRCVARSRDAGARAREAGEPRGCGAEVDDLHVAVATDEDVGRREPTVHDAGSMCGVETLGDGGADVCRALGRDAPGVGEGRGEARAVDVLHRDERSAVLIAPVVDGDDVRVADRCRSTRGPAEPVDDLGVGSQIGGEDLDRDGSVEVAVVGEEDLGGGRRREALPQLVTTGEWFGRH